MPTHRVAAVVEVERVRGSAIDVSGIEHADATRRAEDQARTRRKVERACEEARRVLSAAGERDADGVQNADLRPLDRLGRQIVPAQRGDARAEKAGEAAQLSVRMPVLRIRSRHFSTSDLMCAANCSGGLPAGSDASLAILWITSG